MIRNMLGDEYFRWDAYMTKFLPLDSNDKKDTSQLLAYGDQTIQNYSAEIKMVIECIVDQKFYGTNYNCTANNDMANQKNIC